MRGFGGFAQRRGARGQRCRRRVVSAVEWAPPAPLWAVPARQIGQALRRSPNDVTANDIALAAREGYQAVEHRATIRRSAWARTKRRPATSGGSALMAEQLGVSIPSVGTTTFRPPYTPVTLGAVPGPKVGPTPSYAPLRDARVARGARRALRQRRALEASAFVSACRRDRGRRGEPRGAQRAQRCRGRRRCRHSARSNCRAAMSPSPQPDLHQQVGHARGRTLPLRRDAARRRFRERRRDDIAPQTDALSDDHDHRQCVAAMQQIEDPLQAEWPRSEVYATSVTEQWSAAAISGPKARDVVAVVGHRRSNQAFPFLAVGECRVAAPRDLFPRGFSA